MAEAEPEAERDAQYKNTVAFVITMAAILTVGVAFAGYQLGAHNERQKAINADVGRWTINPATGESAFCYGKTRP
jgi:hypothetical protein